MIQSLQVGKQLPSVPASPPPAASKAGECRVCDSAGFLSTQKLSSAGSLSCTCKALDGYYIPESHSVFKVYEDEVNPLDDWEFAGDEEKEAAEDVEASAESSRAGAITVPDLLQLSLALPREAFPSIAGGSDLSNSSIEVRTEHDGHVDEELGQSRACDWLEPPSPCGAVPMQETHHQMGGEVVMLEAFQQFQHNPQIQEMVLALATDARVWQAVLANKKLQEYTTGSAEGNVEVRITQDLDSAALQGRRFSNFVVISHNSLRELKAGLREQMRVVMDVVEKRLQAETRQLMLDLMVRALTMMSIFMLTLIGFLILLPLQVSRGA
ncbi:hypothetical protein KC19_12G162100 [Ceratodon purpureus]|uniref:Uncharacterized protein n=1 Tax=Ceratodon purpureus TaxID=3225 RepID=A0A8T0GA39_CERPU|nr:hypothetical protein KC19_12G162100 [Ceratodon purpureus]